jgi:hypothetical protein
MKKELIKGFVSDLKNLSAIAKMLTDMENACLVNGEWDEGKIQKGNWLHNKIRNAADKDKKAVWIEEYKRLFNVFNELKERLSSWENLDSLIENIEENLNQSNMQSGYIRNLLYSLYNDSFSVLDTLPKNDYNGGWVLETLELIYIRFMYRIGHLCTGYDIDISDFPDYYKYKRPQPEDASGGKEQKRFPALLTVDEIKALREFCIEKNLISDIKEDSFLYWFGCQMSIPENLQFINWIENKQLARELLVGIYKETITIAEIERTTAVCFQKNKKPMRLSKNKHVPSGLSDDIEKFLATALKR